MMIKFNIKKDLLNTNFVEKSVSINRIVLRAAAVFTVIVELINMARVLLLSNSGLGTLNNRIYFSFYLVYFITSAAFLLIDFCLKLSSRIRYYIYLISAGVILLWHTLFNMYDIHRSDAVGNFTIITAMAVFCSLFVMKPGYALAAMGGSYILFVLFLGMNFSSGEVINFTITASLCLLVYFVRYKHLYIELTQAKLLNDIRQELSETQRNFRLSIEQYELIRERDNYVTFEWDVNADRIRFSEEWNEWFNEPKDIPHFKKFIREIKTVKPEQKEILLKCLEGIKNGIPFQKTELQLPLKTGEKAWFELRVITQTNDQNKPVFGIGMLSDITDQKEKIFQLEQEIQIDLFTGLLNKAAIEHYGERTLAKLQKGEILAALILDMDDFKDINDRFGHPAGDYVLKEVADIIQRKAPVGAKVGRIGGDEFMVLLLTDSLTPLRDYAGELIQEVSRIRWKGKDVGVSCSIGISAEDSSQRTYPELYKAADDALYQAKRRGKNQAWCQGKHYQEKIYLDKK